VLVALAWLGGALFVLSLSGCLYFYAVVLGTPTVSSPSSLAAAIAVNVALFSAFALHHSLLARTKMKRVITGVVPAELERSAYVWVASLLLLAVCWLWQPLPGVVYDVPAPWRWLCYIVQVAGVALTWRGAAVVDVLELAGIRQARHETRPLEFRIVGPFRLVRHPIYLGWILMVFGAPSMTMGRLVFACVSSTYLLLAIPWEERSLIDTFGDRYRAYQAAVPWRIVPGFW
jgi:protein-S-isoprenylcysteine O-methyltransferase Ste14